MSLTFDVFSEDEWASQSAQLISESLPGSGAVIVTGGDSAARLYPSLVAHEGDWSDIEVLFSDERSVPPDDPASNYGMVKQLLLDPRPPRRVHRIRGEDPTARAAERYEQATSEVLERGVEVALLGMGVDCHIAALFPGSPALEAEGFCAAVQRPDGLDGITLTPRALLPARQIWLVVSGLDKAEAVERAVRGDEGPETCPVQVLAGHRGAKLLLDGPAAARL